MCVNLFFIFIFIYYVFMYLLLLRVCCERINKRIDKIELYFCLIRIIFIVLRVKDEKDADLFRSCVLNIDSWNVNDFFVRAIWNRTKKKKKRKRKTHCTVFYPFLFSIFAYGEICKKEYAAGSKSILLFWIVKKNVKFEYGDIML